MTRMKKRIWPLVFFACMVATPAAAKWNWLDGNTVTLPDYGVKIARPDDRWRVLEPSYPALVEMRFLLSGQNAVMTLKDVPGNKAKKWRVNASPQETERLLEPYRAAGWQFFKTERDEDRIDAEATDASRRILLLRFARKNSTNRGTGWFIVEAVFPREIYQNAYPAFRTAAASLEQTRSD